MGRIALTVLTLMFFTASDSFAEKNYQPTLPLKESSCLMPAGNPVMDISTDITEGGLWKRRLNDTANWVFSVDSGGGADRAGVLFSDGTMKVLSLETGNLRTVFTVRDMAPDSPPVHALSLGSEPIGGLIAVDDRGDLISIDTESGNTRRLASGFSPVTYPAAADLDGDGDIEIAAVSDEGFMTVIKGRTQVRTDSMTRLLPDTRVIVDDLDGDGRPEIIALSLPVNVKDTGRLGDDIEASGLAVFGWDGKRLRLEDEYRLPEGSFFETLMPTICREDGGIHRINLVTNDRAAVSSLLGLVYVNGKIRRDAVSTTITRGGMLHLIGCAKLGDSKGILVVAVALEDDAEGDLELFQLDLVRKRANLRSGIYSHIFGSRVLETSLIADFNGDGILELLAPSDGMTDLSMYELHGSSLKERTVYSGSRKISTNLCSGDFDGNGRADVIFGLEDGTLIVLEGE